MLRKLRGRRRGGAEEVTASSWEVSSLPWLSPSPAESTGINISSPLHPPPPITVFSGRREAVRSLPCSAGWCWAPLFLLPLSPNVGVPFRRAGGEGEWSREMLIFIVWGEMCPIPGRSTVFGSIWLFCCLGNSSTGGKEGGLVRKAAGGRHGEGTLSSASEALAMLWDPLIGFWLQPVVAIGVKAQGWG